MTDQQTTVILFEVPANYVSVSHRVTDDDAGISWIPAPFAPFVRCVRVRFNGEWFQAEPVYFSEKPELTWIKFRIYPLETSPKWAMYFDFIHDRDLDYFHPATPEDWLKWEAVYDG